MPKIYLLGGENVSKRSAKEINECAFKDAGDRPSVLVFPWARASFDQKYSKRKLLFDYLLSLGAISVDFVEYTDPRESIAEKLGSAKLVYLTGGLPTVLIERLKVQGIDTLLKDYEGVIVGRSAGALALCKKCITTIRQTKRVRKVTGLGFVDIALKVHYTPENDLALIRLSQESRIYAVPQESALVSEDGRLWPINSVFVFEGGEKSVFR